MRTSRLGRPARAGCLRLVLAFALFTVSPVLAVEAAVSGIVVDQSGQPLPRALVRGVDPTGVQIFSTFADEGGRFRAIASSEHCRLEVSLTGFAPATVPCAASTRVVLTVAPIEETVVVSVTRTEAPADQTGASVTTFTAEDLERRNVPLVADLLRSTPGVMVSRAGGVGTVTGLFVRGGESNHNKVLLDGIPLNEPGGTFNFSNLTTENLERIEIVRGAQSALFGSDAMASVIQLFTKRPSRSDERPHVALSFEGGTYGTVRGAAAASGTAGDHARLDYSFGVSRFNTDNHAPNNRFENTTLSANVGIALSDTATLRVIGRGELEHVGTPGQTAFGPPDLDAFFERHDGTLGVTFDQLVTHSFRQRASYSLAASNQQSTNQIGDPDYTPRFGDHVGLFPSSDFAFDTLTRLKRHHASYQADWHLTSDAASHGDHRLTLVADWDGERAALIDRLAATDMPVSRDNFGASIEHQALWPRTFVTLGARIEHNGSFGTRAVPRGSMVYVARTGSGWLGETRLKASGGLGIKEPTIPQSFSPSPFFHGNPELRPERSRTIDAGIQQRLGADRARIDATWFDSRYLNLISLITTNPETFAAQYFNVGESEARGAELAVDVAPIRALRARAGYTFLASEIISSTAPMNPVFTPGQWLFRRPRHSGFFNVAVLRDRLTADLNGVFIGRFVDSDFASLQPPLLSNPGYTTWDVRASYRLTPRFRALMSVDNLGNAQYMEQLGYPALGRAGRIGLRAEF